MKLADRRIGSRAFLQRFEQRRLSLAPLFGEFKQEMKRFLSVEQAAKGVEKEELWAFVQWLVADLGEQLAKICACGRSP